MRGGVAERGGTGRAHRKENKREERSDDGGGASLTLEHDPIGVTEHQEGKVSSVLTNGLAEQRLKPLKLSNGV